MKIAMAIEGSNSRGMGHVFRSLQYIKYLKEKKIDYVYLINDDAQTLGLLNREGIKYSIVDYEDYDSNWEKLLIQSENIDVWFNDKFYTGTELVSHIKGEGIFFSCLDDVGPGADEADVCFAGTIYATEKRARGKKFYYGSKYVTLNKEIDQYKRQRNKFGKIVVSMGGSDPFEVTIDLVRCLKEYDYDVDIVIGPNFKKKSELMKINNHRFPIYQNVPSLIQFFSKHELAITGGGVTACEANAAGLPCLVIANAPHEINTGKWLEELGGAVFLGKYDNWVQSIFEHLDCLDIEKMSRAGMESFDTKGIERIFGMIEKEYESYEKGLL